MPASILSRARAAFYALGLLAAGLLLAGCAARPAANQNPPPPVTAAAEGAGDEVKVSAEGQGVILDVRSQSGIGSAAVDLAAETVPESLVLRLHLKGLEEFRLSYADTTIVASVSSSDGHRVAQRLLLADGSERPIEPGDPSWLKIQIVSDQAAPKIPLDQGYFEITLPKEFLEAGRGAFSIRWIDFYR